MQLHVIEAGFFKLDGGAMFGVVPKSIWQKANPPDENNLCTWAMRCLLIEEGNRLMLVDNGIGNKQDQRFFSHYFLHGTTNIEISLNKAGFSPDDVTDMFLTHLHFDHCGGGVKKAEGKSDKFDIVFKNASYWSHSSHWQWATNPNAREKASFLKENILPMKESGHLKFADQKPLSFPATDYLTADGHTEKQMLPRIKYKNYTIIFAADLLPSVGHIPLPYVMAYDTRPLISLEEKKKFLEEAVENKYIIFFEHDPQVECCTLKFTEKGIRADQLFKLRDIL